MSLRASVGGTQRLTTLFANSHVHWWFRVLDISPSQRPIWQIRNSLKLLLPNKKSSRYFTLWFSSPQSLYNILTKRAPMRSTSIHEMFAAENTVYIAHLIESVFTDAAFVEENPHILHTTAAFVKVSLVRISSKAF